MEQNKYNKDCYKLFFRKELHVILGKRKANWWILFTMFLFTILSISFSKSSLTYLDQKMNDPFINWVNVQNTSNAPINKLIQEVSNTKDDNPISKRFGFQSFEENIYRNLVFVTDNNKLVPFEGRTIQSTSSILERILDKNNLIEGRTLLANPKSLGLIITKDMLSRLGYDKTPLYVDLAFPFDLSKETLVNSLGLKVSSDYFGVPIPVIAVVKQLPGMMSFLCSEYLVQQRDNQDNTFDLTKPEYCKSLEYVSNDNSLLNDSLKALISTLTTRSFDMEETEEKESFIDCKHWTIIFDQVDSIPSNEIGKISSAINSHFAKNSLKRVYTFNTTSQTITIPTDYLSINFLRLDSIKSFAQWANEECFVQIDMTQIDAKNNFNIISRLGNALSYAILAISIAFIVIFLMNLFRSHFEKIKKNIGTFKAFGMSNNWLISVYMLVLSTMILSALTLAFLLSLLIEFITAKIGILNEGAPIFDVLSDITLISISATIIISIVTIFITTKQLLQSTPGDLIYERD